LAVCGTSGAVLRFQKNTPPATQAATTTNAATSTTGRAPSFSLPREFILRQGVLSPARRLHFDCREMSFDF
jgi:hypothetical protein